MAAVHIGMHAGAAAQNAVKRAMPVLPEGKVGSSHCLSLSLHCLFMFAAGQLP